jgi:tetratricopeptide (TPR) repeat protein
MAELERRWERRVAWWEMEFPKADDGKKIKGPRPDSAPESASITRGREVDALDSAPSIPPPASAMRNAWSARMANPAMMADAVGNDSARWAEDAARPASPDQPDGASSGGMDIVLQPWRSNASYSERMNRAGKEEMYAIYLDERPGHERNAGFFMDMADRFFARDMPKLGLRILSNLAEIEAESRQLLRVLAYRLLEAGEMRLALGILEKVRELAPHEPQSLRDLALAHQRLGNHRQAAELLYETARRAWDERFQDINVIALTELNALVATAGKALDAGMFDSRLIRNLPSDLRVTLAWDADNADMDLWVTDPDGESCYYDHTLTKQGGAMSRDCTGGYGPEEFMLRRAKPGKYRVEADYYGDRRQSVGGEISLYISLITGFGTPGQQEKVIVRRLKDKKERILVGEFTVE